MRGGRDRDLRRPRRTPGGCAKHTRLGALAFPGRVAHTRQDKFMLHPEEAAMIIEVDREVDAPEADEPAKKRGGGPRTPAGREASRRNAMKDGMRARVLLPVELEAAVDE